MKKAVIFLTFTIILTSTGCTQNSSMKNMATPVTKIEEPEKEITKKFENTASDFRIKKYTFAEFENSLKCAEDQVRGCYSDNNIQLFMEDIKKLQDGQYPTREEWPNFLFNNRKTITDESFNFIGTYFKLANYNGVFYFSQGGCCDYYLGNILLNLLIVDENNIYKGMEFNIWKEFTNDELNKIDRALSGEKVSLQQFPANFEGQIIEGPLSEEEQQKLIRRFEEIKEGVESELL